MEEERGVMNLRMRLYGFCMFLVGTVPTGRDLQPILTTEGLTAGSGNWNVRMWIGLDWRIVIFRLFWFFAFLLYGPAEAMELVSVSSKAGHAITRST